MSIIPTITADFAARSRRLYRETHDTFEAYCRDRWEMSRRNANRLIRGAETAEVLGPNGVKPTDKLPANEAQARPLTNCRRWCIAPYVTPRGHARVLLGAELIGSLSSGVTIHSHGS